MMHVVHLEDDGPLRDILKVALQAVAPDIRLRQFIDSDSALEYIRANGDAVDLFILDIRVPGTMDGMQLAGKIRELKCTGAIAITSAFRAPDRTLLNQLNCQWFAKPWHIMEVTEKLIPLSRRS
jgi:DNA-binding response OmpR family regulator